MKQGNGPKWILGAAVGAMSVAAAPVVAWACLPVAHGAGSVQMYARPTGMFSDTFDLRIVNEGTDTEIIMPESNVYQKGEPMFYTCTIGLEWGHLEPGESRAMPVRPGTDSHFSRPKPPGLHRLTIQHDGFHSSPAVDIWVLNVGDKTFAVK